MVVMQEVTRATRSEGLWDLLYTYDLLITAQSEEEANRKFGVWKREMETTGVKGKVPMWGLWQRHWSNLIWCQCCEKWCHQSCSGLRNLRKAGDNFRCPTCVRGVVVVPQRLEVEEDSLEIVDSFHYLGDKISTLWDRISCAWSK